MKRRDFLARTTTGVAASLLGSVWSGGYSFVNPALAADAGDAEQCLLEVLSAGWWLRRENFKRIAATGPTSDDPNDI